MKKYVYKSILYSYWKIAVDYTEIYFTVSFLELIKWVLLGNTGYIYKNKEIKKLFCYIFLNTIIYLCTLYVCLLIQINMKYLSIAPIIFNIFLYHNFNLFKQIILLLFYNAHIYEKCNKLLFLFYKLNHCTQTL